GFQLVGGEARVWDAATGKLITRLPHGRAVTSASFSPDGRQIVTSSLDGTARVWDAASGKPATPPLRHDAAVHHACFSPDGRHVATASSDQSARGWDEATGEPVTPPLPHSYDVWQVEFSPDGRRLLTANELPGAAYLWDLGFLHPSPRGLQPLSQLLTSRQM